MIGSRRFFKFGLPLILFVVLGSFGLSEFTSLRVEKRDEKNRMLTAEETLKFQKKVQKVEIEQEFEDIKSKVNIDQWENKRGPRPWETDSKP